MRHMLTVVCVLLMEFVSFTLLPLNSISASAAERQKLTESDDLVQKYFEESRILSEEFTPLYRQLQKEGVVALSDGQKVPDFERWEKEYYQPLFEKSKRAMLRVSGVNDYLSMWESEIPLKIITDIRDLSFDKNKAEDIQTTTIPYNLYDMPFNWFPGMQLFALSTLAVVYERRNEILRNTVYEDTENGAKIRALSSYIRNPWTVSAMSSDSEIDNEARTTFERMGIWYVFPPRYDAMSFDYSWCVMAIYSFKNERAREVLYKMALRSFERDDSSLSDWAVYYLTLSPDSKSFLPKVKAHLKELIGTFQKDESTLSQTLFDETGGLLDRSMDVFRKTLTGLRPSRSSQEEKTYQLLDAIRRLLVLERSLEFNEKIPENERKRFEIVRRELAISWALAPKYNRAGPHITASLKKGEEQFEIYAADYEIPAYGTQSFDWEEYGKSSIYSDEKYRQEIKHFYENELANPRLKYSDVQKKYLQKKLDIIREIERRAI